MSFSGPYFPVFGLNTEIYYIFLYSVQYTGTYGPEKTLYLDNFRAVSVNQNLTRTCKLTHFWSMFPFDTPWRHQKTLGFLMFSGDIKWEHQLEKDKLWKFLEVPVFLYKLKSEAISTKLFFNTNNWHIKEQISIRKNPSETKFYLPTFFNWAAPDF